MLFTNKIVARMLKLVETGFNYTMSLIQGKYKMFILYALMEYKIVRFNELKNILNLFLIKL